MAERPQVAEPRADISTGHTPRRCHSGSARASQPAAQHHRRRGDPGQRRRGRPASARAATSAAGRSTSQDSRLHYAHNYVGRRYLPRISPRPAPCRPASAPLRVRAHREARLRAGQGRPGPGPAVRRRPAHRQTSSRSPRPWPLTRAASPAAPIPALRSFRTTRPRSRSPAPCTP